MKPILFTNPLALLCVLGFTTVLHAQTSALPPLPPGPLIQTRAPDFAEWVITQRPGSLEGTASNAASVTPALGAAAPVSTQDTVTKTHDVIRVVRVDSSRQAYTIWCHGAQEYMIWPDGKSCAQLTPGQKHFVQNPFFIDFSASDYSGFDWIAPRYYTGLKSYGGVNCIVYQAQLGVPDDSAGSSASLMEIAYVDLQSRLPIALQRGGDLYLYKWNPAPQDALSYPPMVKALIDAGVKAQHQMSQKAVSAY